MKKHAIIVAGGTGKRMGTEIPKQFLKLGSKPVLMHTIEKFKKYDSEIEIILVLPKHQFEYWEMLCEDFKFEIKHTIVEGGEKRFFSVKNGLSAIDDNEGIVAIHDGVRPCVSRETIDACFQLAAEKGNAIPYFNVQDSIRVIEDDKSSIVNRSKYKIIQTPQVFDLKSIKDAYNCEFLESFTDDASVYERAGHKINLVLGNKENIKITHPTDLRIAELFIEG